jgi:quinol monooxygenase YgiN
MAILATAEFRIHPEKLDEFLGVMKAALPDTRSFEGCEGLETFTNQDEAGHVIIIEKWTDRRAHEKYLAWRIEGGMLELLGPYAAAPPTFAYFDAHPDV